jgi:hypothetical protein
MDFAKFPARVTMADGHTLDPAAIVVRAGQVALAERLPNLQPFEWPTPGEVVNVESLPNGSTRVSFEDGTSWLVERGKGCGCSSPTQRWWADRIANWQPE